MWHQCQRTPAPPPQVLLDVSTAASSPSSPHICGQTNPAPLRYTAAAVVLPPQDVSKPGSVHPQSHSLEPFRGRHSPAPVATRSASRPPLWFHCLPLRRNVPVPFPRRLPGKDGHDGSHQGRLSRLPQPCCHASHSHNPPSPSPPWAWPEPRGPCGDVALTSNSWGPATTKEG